MCKSPTLHLQSADLPTSRAHINLPTAVQNALLIREDELDASAEAIAFALVIADGACRPDVSEEGTSFAVEAVAEAGILSLTIRCCWQQC